MKYLPEPQYYPSDRGPNICITPYRTLDWQETAERYGIKLPIIVDMSCGKSICQSCGAVYVGRQIKCELQVEYHRPPGSWHDQRGPHPHYKVFLKECGEYTKWDLLEVFDTQKDFFDLLAVIGSLPDLERDPLVKFRDNFPPGVADVLRIRILSNKIVMLENQIPQIQLALTQIANKMNSAGACLSFGF